MAKVGEGFSDDPAVSKYYGQRHRLWSRFDEGVWMTRGGWYEVTPEGAARVSADLHRGREKKGCVLDLFCGCGGDTVQLAQVYDKVIAVDCDADAIEAAHKNTQIYGVADRVSFLCCDFLSLKPENLKVDAVHCSPPWGGEFYASAPFFDMGLSLQSTLGVDFSKFFDFLLSFSTNITMFLPRNVLLYTAVARGFRGDFAVCRHYVNDRCKAVTLFWGDMIDCSSLKEPPAPVYCLKHKVAPRIEKRARGA